MNTETMVRILIKGQNGHTTLEQRINEACETVANNTIVEGMWPWVNTETGAVPFQFTATSINDTVNLLKDTIRLRQILADSEEPVVVMMGPLAGGTN